MRVGHVSLPFGARASEDCLPGAGAVSRACCGAPRRGRRRGGAGIIALYPRRRARRGGGSVIGAGLGGPESLVDWLLRSVGLAPLASRAASSTQRAERGPEWPPPDARPRPGATARRRRPRARGREPWASTSTRRTRDPTAGAS